MPFGFGSNKREKEPLFNTHLIDADDLEEINKITEMLNPDEKILLVAKQPRIKPGGSVHTPNIIYATDRRIIIRDPYMLGIRVNVIDIPYDIITSVKLEKGLLSSTIRFKAPGLMSSTRLGMMDSIVDGEDNDQGGVIEAIPKGKAQDLLEIIRSGTQHDSNQKLPPSKKQQQPFEPLESKEQFISSIQSISIADIQKIRSKRYITISH
jgi:Bacterial PH domain